MLPAKNRLARLTSSQAIPQPDLRRRHPAPKILRDADCSRWRSHVPNLMRPLHRASRGPPPPLSRGRMLYTLCCPHNYAGPHEGTIMPGETKALAEFAAEFRYDDIPQPAVAIAKACIIDTVGVVLFGSTLPWSKIVDDYVHHTGTGASSILDKASARPARRAPLSPTARSRMRSSSTICASPRPACIPAPPCSPAHSPRRKKPRSAARS